MRYGGSPRSSSAAGTLRVQLLEATQRAATFEERAKHGDELRAVIREREQALARIGEEASKVRERAAELQTRGKKSVIRPAEKLKLVTEAKEAMEHAFKRCRPMR